MIATKGSIDSVEQNLVLGIIQPPPKDMKRFDKMTREEYLEQRRASLGPNYSDEYDDEDYSDDERDSDWDGESTRGLTAIPTTRNRVNPVVLKPNGDLT